jgi:four helix bundle protein
MGTYRNLLAWQRAMDLVDAVYAAARGFPNSEQFCMSFQFRKAALSIPLNIAEGRGRATNADQRHFLVQARGSVAEVDTLIQVAQRQGFLTDGQSAELGDLTAEVGRLVNGLIKSLTPNA